MTFKQAVIKTMDVCLGIGFVILGMIVLFLCLDGMISQAIIFGVIGWIVLCSISGFWFILSSIHDNLVKQSKLLEKMLDKE